MCKLRAHHALCIRFFQGKGYSPGFTAHMQEVTGILWQTDPEITLLTGCDTLCSACPHQSQGVCRSAEKVLRFDRNVLRLCRLEAGTSLRWSALCAEVNRAILLPGTLRSVCGTCEWFPLCSTSEPVSFPGRFPSG